MKESILAFALAIALSSAFVPSAIPAVSLLRHHHASTQLYSSSENVDDLPSLEFSSADTEEGNVHANKPWDHEKAGIQTHKLTFRSPHPDERGKGGVSASESIQALEVVARIPRSLILVGGGDFFAYDGDAPRAVEAAANAQNRTWVTDLTAATLVALHPTLSELAMDKKESSSGSTLISKQQWVQSWVSGGWATHGSDLGPPEAQFGQKCTTGSLLSTGSDNDANIYAKFRLPCHPAIHRAAVGLAFLTNMEDGEEECREALARRGAVFRSMRDALLPLVLEPTERERLASMRERRAWDVADVLSRMLSRATLLQLPGVEGEISTPAVVPLHERLAQCDARGENVKLIADDGDGGIELLLVATRDIEQGEDLTRDYTTAPRLMGDETQGALHLLLQFGLPPNAWS
eukprot:CAMPEP_0171296784 /NCGR_PEP_ID=MMETSP0816-20121228/5506_1 /TAXON_ID=420281 /ORGANISM="Proboscia inermis, Strain CCAP1064/1" /LENGTH=405 /DNA_ID=CAMNT_0011770537 /DNA_START=90 /DNA_END=1307 /DNA_ORIENTATION=+